MVAGVALARRRRGPLGARCADRAHERQQLFLQRALCLGLAVSAPVALVAAIAGWQFPLRSAAPRFRRKLRARGPRRLDRGHPWAGQRLLAGATAPRSDARASPSYRRRCARARRACAARLCAGADHRLAQAAPAAVLLFVPHRADAAQARRGSRASALHPARNRHRHSQPGIHARSTQSGRRFAFLARERRAAGAVARCRIGSAVLLPACSRPLPSPMRRGPPAARARLRCCASPRGPCCCPRRCSSWPLFAFHRPLLAALYDESFPGAAACRRAALRRQPGAHRGVDRRCSRFMRRPAPGRLPLGSSSRCRFSRRSPSPPEIG